MTRLRAGLHPTILLLMGTHVLVDGFGAVFTPLLPLLIPQLNLSLAAVGTLQMCFQLSTSMTQLGFGTLADRWRPRVLLTVGPLISVTVMALVGVSTSIWMLAAVLIVGGLGGAAFHPPAAALVHRYGGARKSVAMAFHISSGNFGQALAPLVFAPVAERWGMGATAWLMVPAFIACVLLLRAVPPVSHLQEQPAAGRGGFKALKPYRRPLGLLYAIVVVRTVTALSFGTFMTVLLTRMGMSVSQAGMAAAVYMLGSTAGGFIGGRLADSWGPRLVIIVSLVSAVPFLMAAPFFSGWAFVALVACGGFLLQSSLPVNVTFGQTIAPISAATVSSLMMGFAWGTGGLLAPVVGFMADRIGIERMMVTMSVLPLLAAALALPLPKGKIGRSHAHVKAVEATGTDVAR